MEMMKKLLSIVLAVLMIVSLLSAVALADDIPQPEGGKKFESDWAIRGMLVQIVYEEEGYRVSVNSRNNEEQTGTLWEYSCYYMEDSDSLSAVSAFKHKYTIDADGYQELGEYEYEGLLVDGKEVTFTIDENGKLNWQDGIENAGADLGFQNIGRFSGTWRNDAEEVAAEIIWEGLNEERFYYSVYINRGNAQAYTDFIMTGKYNPENGKLECEGTAESHKVTDGIITSENDGEIYDAFFSFTDSGKLLFETDNGIELDYDFMPLSNG